ncbi:MAG: hypothetical protein V3V18_06890 [Methylococcales bacterium]
MLSYIFFTSVAFGESSWNYRLDIPGEGGVYSNSRFRNAIAGAGLFVRADHPAGGVTLGYNRTRINFKAGIGDIDQDDWFVSGRLHFQPALLTGKLSTRLDIYRVDNNDPGDFTDDVVVIAPQVSWINQNQSLYFDLGYAHSIYRHHLDINQFTPTVGFAFNQKYDWIQLRSYLIHSTDSLRSQGKSETIAVEAKWTHYFGHDMPLGALENIKIGLLAGERVFAVDGDTADVFNLSNTQKGSVSLTTQWALTDNQKLLFGFSLSRYKNGFVGDTYILPLAYANYSISF